MSKDARSNSSDTVFRGGGCSDVISLGHQNLSRVHDAIGIERVFHATHQLDLDRRLVMGELLAFEASDAVLGADRAVEAHGDVMDDAVEFLAPLQEHGFVGRLGLVDVVVNVAIANMTERVGPDAGQALGDAFFGAFIEFATLLTGTETSCLWLPPSCFCASTTPSRMRQRSRACAPLAATTPSLTRPAPIASPRKCSSMSLRPLCASLDETSTSTYQGNFSLSGSMMPGTCFNAIST